MTKNNNRGNAILIWGGGSQARLVLGMLRDDVNLQHLPIYIFATDLRWDLPSGHATLITTAGQLADVLPLIRSYVVAIGNEHGRARMDIHQRLSRLGLSAHSIRSPNAHLEASSVAASGLVMMPGAIVQRFCGIGEQCIINTAASIDHECQLGNGVHIMGAAAVAGRVVIHDFATIGTNATVLPDLVIGEGAFVGAGSVVTRDVKPFEVVAGNPAHHLRAAKLQRGEPDDSWFEQLARYHAEQKSDQKFAEK